MKRVVLSVLVLCVSIGEAYMSHLGAQVVCEEEYCGKELGQENGLELFHIMPTSRETTQVDNVIDIGEEEKAPTPSELYDDEIQILPEIKHAGSYFNKVYKNMFAPQRVVWFGEKEFVINNKGHICGSNFRTNFVFSDKAQWLIPIGAAPKFGRIVAQKKWLKHAYGVGYYRGNFTFKEKFINMANYANGTKSLEKFMSAAISLAVSKSSNVLQYAISSGPDVGTLLKLNRVTGEFIVISKGQVVTFFKPTTKEPLKYFINKILQYEKR